jgi:hypothetical protein
MAQGPNPPPGFVEEPSVSLSRFVGIKNVVGEERLTPQEFSSAVNVDLDDAGQVRRRRGQKLVAAGNWHSLYQTVDGVNLGVRDNALGVISSDYSFTVLQTGIGANPANGSQLAYEQVGNNVYFTSPYENGVIDEDARTVSPWGADPDIWLSPVVNPTATLPAIRGKLIGKPPMATDIAYFNGRLYMAQGRLLWATELFLYNYVDRTRNFYQFDADITMIGAVGDGIYIGTEEGCWFLSGPFSEMKRVRVLDSPVIPGSRVYSPSELANPPQIDLGSDQPVSLAVLFMTTNGYCAGQNSGTVFNLTESKVVFPVAARAYPFYRKQDGAHHYVVGLDSGGSPAASTRIGDYVAADLVRAGNWLELDDGVLLGDRTRWNSGYALNAASGIAIGDAVSYA